MTTATMTTETITTEAAKPVRRRDATARRKPAAVPCRCRMTGKPCNRGRAFWACLDAAGHMVYRSGNYGAAWAYRHGHSGELMLVEVRLLAGIGGDERAEPNEQHRPGHDLPQ